MTVLKLKKEIFELSYITAASAAYRQLADITVADGLDYWHCTFSGCKYNPEQTMAEFENYLIDMMNCKAQ